MISAGEAQVDKVLADWVRVLWPTRVSSLGHLEGSPQRWQRTKSLVVGRAALGLPLPVPVPAEMPSQLLVLELAKTCSPMFGSRMGALASLHPESQGIGTCGEIFPGFGVRHAHNWGGIISMFCMSGVYVDCKSRIDAEFHDLLTIQRSRDRMIHVISINLSYRCLLPIQRQVYAGYSHRPSSASYNHAGSFYGFVSRTASGSRYRYDVLCGLQADCARSFFFGQDLSVPSPPRRHAALIYSQKKSFDI
jgi:hypothetical protein